MIRNNGKQQKKKKKKTTEDRKKDGKCRNKGSHMRPMLFDSNLQMNSLHVSLHNPFTTTHYKSDIKLNADLISTNFESSI